MVRTLLALALCSFALPLAACGEKDEPNVTGPPVIDQPADGAANPGSGGVALREIGEFAAPVFLTQPAGEAALYVVEQGGRIMRVAPNRKPRVFLDISNEVSTENPEQGLLSVAFAPDYKRSGLLYVDYTNEAGDSRIVEYRRSKRDATKADPRTAREVLAVDQPYANHNGGLLLFGPDDNLYIGFGDGGSAGDPERRGQDLGELLGKILRIDPRPGNGKPYRIPAGNPFVDQAGARPEILAYGLRNPWRFSFDRRGGALWIGDVGQDEQEEIDVLEAVDEGANFGWSAFEGTAEFNDDQEAPDALEPVLTYGRDGGCSLTGGYVVRDPALKSLLGRYLYADFCQGQLRSFSAGAALAAGARDDRALGVQVPAVSSFAEDARGHIYTLSLEGPVYRLIPEGK